MSKNYDNALAWCKREWLKEGNYTVDTILEGAKQKYPNTTNEELEKLHKYMTRWYDIHSWKLKGAQ